MTPESATPGLALRDGLVINQAAILREMLVQALANGTRAVDLSAVSDCDTAGVQLLISACKTAEASGGPLVLRAASPAVQEIMTRYGLARLLEGGQA